MYWKAFSPSIWSITCRLPTSISTQLHSMVKDKRMRNHIDKIKSIIGRFSLYEANVGEIRVSPFNDNNFYVLWDPWRLSWILARQNMGYDYHLTKIIALITITLKPQLTKWPLYNFTLKLYDFNFLVSKWIKLTHEKIKKYFTIQLCSMMVLILFFKKNGREFMRLIQPLREDKKEILVKYIERYGSLAFIALGISSSRNMWNEGRHTGRGTFRLFASYASRSSLCFSQWVGAIERTRIWGWYKRRLTSLSLDMST